MSKPFTPIVLIATLCLCCTPALAIPPIDSTWEASEWNVPDVGPTRCSLVKEGCEVTIAGKAYTLYSVIQFPVETRYSRKWNVELEARLEHGAAGIALGNRRTGLIFQVTENDTAEILFYSGKQNVKPEMSRRFRSDSKDFTLGVRYDSQSDRCLFMVNGKTVFDLFQDQMPNLPMTSNITQVAVTTAIPEGRRKAETLHKRVRVRGQ